jgi:excisionase family DNA binding protein
MKASKPKPMPTTAPPALLTATEIAGILRCSVRTVYELLRTGAIPTVRVGQRLLKVKPDDLAAYIESRRTAGWYASCKPRGSSVC